MTNVQVIMFDRQTARSERPLRASHAATREAAMPGIRQELAAGVKKSPGAAPRGLVNDQIRNV